MNTIKIESGKTKMVAHRGVSGLEKENTCAAFVAAGNRSHFGIETDVHKTADGKYVIIHDDSTGRVCATEMSVENSAFDELRALTLLGMDGEMSRSDLKIPTLEEYITICKKYQKIAVLELKNAFSQAEVYEICGSIDALGWLEHTVFISFCLENLLFLREKYPTQPAQFLVDDFEEGLMETLVSNKLDLDIKYTALTRENIALLHKNKVLVNCWTCNDPADAQKLVEWGVDYITSNILE